MPEKTKDQLLQEKEKEILLLKGKLEKVDAAKKRSWNFKVWLTKRFAGRGLNESITKLYKELPNKVTKETLGDVSASVIWRITRIGIFALLAAFIPYVLLYNQNKLFKAQNKLFENQNTRIDQQTKLVEAQRRSSYVLLMSNILDKVDEELKDAEDIPYHKSRKLSELTIGRIAALSQSLKPYYYLDGDTLISKPLSPERGQLLLALANSKLDTIKTYPSIYSKSVFKYADLQDAKMDSLFLSRCNLDGANLQNASLMEANLVNTRLREANLQGSILDNANMLWCILEDANLKNASMAEVNLMESGLYGANLDSAFLLRANLKMAILYSASLQGTRFLNANLYGVNFEGAKLNGVILDGANLDSLTVIKGDWTKYLAELNYEDNLQIEGKWAFAWIVDTHLNDTVVILKDRLELLFGKDRLELLQEF